MGEGEWATYERHPNPKSSQLAADPHTHVRELNAYCFKPMKHSSGQDAKGIWWNKQTPRSGTEQHGHSERRRKAAGSPLSVPGSEMQDLHKVKPRSYILLQPEGSHVLFLCPFRSMPLSAHHSCRQRARSARAVMWAHESWQGKISEASHAQGVLLIFLKTTITFLEAVKSRMARR